MTTGKKRPRIIKGSKAGVEGSKSAVESTHTNPYLYFLDAYQKKAKAANKGPKFIIAKYSKLAAEVWKKMSDAEKASFVDMAKERKARINKNVPRETKKNALPVFRSRCSPLKLVKVNEALTKEQKDAVERVGFGSMLKLKCRLLNREFISQLVNHFNPATKSLEFGRVRVYTITPDDVRRALGFSCGTIAVPTNCEENHFEHIRKMFGEGKKPLKRGVTFAMMQQVFKTGISDVKFQTSYVLFVLSCLLCPTTKDVAATRFYPAVHDISQTPTYAWAEFVFDWLVKEISKYKKRSAKVADSKNKKDALGVGGCMLLLMLIYFDKQPMGMKVGSEGDPMIQSWTTKLIKERIVKEENLELVDPISGHFPEPRLRHPLAIAAYHDLKKYFLVQMQHLEVLDRALMGDVPETCTRNPSKRKASNERQSLNMGKNVTEGKNPNEDYVEMGNIDMDLEDIPSASTLNTKKVGDGVDVEDMDAGRMSGIDNLVCARKMPFYSLEHVMADVVQHVQHVEVEEQSVVEKQVEKEEDEEEEQEEDEEEDNEEEEEVEEEEVEEQVPLTPPLNKRPRTRIQKWISQSKLYS